MDAQLPATPSGDLDDQARQSAAMIAKVIDSVALLPKVDIAQLAWVAEQHISSVAAIADAIGPTLKAIDMIRPVYLDAIAEFTSPRWMKMAQEMADAQSRALKSVMDMLAHQPFIPSLWQEPVMSAFDVPSSSKREVIHIHETHITINIQTLAVSMEGAERENIDQPAPLPEAGCLILDTFIALRQDDDDQGIWYLKHGKWNFAHLPPQAVNILLYLYQMRLRPDRYAQRVKDIADAMHKKQESISRELRRIERLCTELGIKPVVDRTSEKRWCLGAQLSCCRNLWS